MFIKCNDDSDSSKERWLILFVQLSRRLRYTTCNHPPPKTKKKSNLSAPLNRTQRRHIRRTIIRCIADMWVGIVLTTQTAVTVVSRYRSNLAVTMSSPLRIGHLRVQPSHGRHSGGQWWKTTATYKPKYFSPDY